ncbi:MAG: DUF1858 domain-containing protein [Clostridia bacterium]
MFTKTMKIIEVLQTNPLTANVFADFNMGCVGCLAARGETVEQAASVHGIDADELINALNKICD